MSIIEFFKKRRAKKHLRHFSKHIRYIAHVNDDIFADSTKEKLNELLEDSKAVDAENPEAVSDFLKKGADKAMNILPKRTHPILREYADILAVALTVAFGLRALYLQPFKIPTSSMQPTLFGIHYIKDTELPDGSRTLPELPQPLHYLLYSTQTAKQKIVRDGDFNPNTISQYTNKLFNERTSFYIGGIKYDLPGDFSHVFKYCNFQSKVDVDEMIDVGFDKSFVEDPSHIVSRRSSSKLEYMDKIFTAGETLCNGWLSLGDHLFVDRVTFHFRDPARGDITIFTTNGIYTGSEGYFFIKRLIGMPGDHLKIIDNMVYVKPKGQAEFKPITDFGIEGINRIYSGKGGYHGHLPYWLLSPSEDERDRFKYRINSNHPYARVAYADDGGLIVPENCYFMMGDNSANSSDSRYWGFVPRKNIIGKAFFIFWPISRRWGIAGNTPPLDVPTRKNGDFFPAMNLQ